MVCCTGSSSPAANPGSQVTWQLIVPRQQRPLLFQEAHPGATSGHFAYKRTLEKLRQFAYWPGMSRDVEEWCRSCDTCAKRRSPVPRSKNRAPMGHIAAACPFEKIAIDLMGPLPETPTGNKHLLVVCDYFSKWVELLALPDIRAETVAERLVEDVFSRFGVYTATKENSLSHRCFKNFVGCWGSTKHGPLRIILRATAW